MYIINYYMKKGDFYDDISRFCNTPFVLLYFIYKVIRFLIGLVRAIRERLHGSAPRGKLS